MKLFECTLRNECLRWVKCVAKMWQVLHDLHDSAHCQLPAGKDRKGRLWSNGKQHCLFHKFPSMRKRSTQSRSRMRMTA